LTRVAIFAAKTFKRVINEYDYNLQLLNTILMLDYTHKPLGCSIKDFQEVIIQHLVERFVEKVMEIPDDLAHLDYFRDFWANIDGRFARFVGERLNDYNYHGKGRKGYVLDFRVTRKCLVCNKTLKFYTEGKWKSNPPDKSELCFHKIVRISAEDPVVDPDTTAEGIPSPQMKPRTDDHWNTFEPIDLEPVPIPNIGAPREPEINCDTEPVPSRLTGIGRSSTIITSINGEPVENFSVNHPLAVQLGLVKASPKPKKPKKKVTKYEEQDKGCCCGADGVENEHGVIQWIECEAGQSQAVGMGYTIPVEFVLIVLKLVVLTALTVLSGLVALGLP
jgi:hypothetical protein